MPHGPGPTWFDHLRELGRELARALRTAAKRPTFGLYGVVTARVVERTREVGIRMQLRAMVDDLSYPGISVRVLYVNQDFAEYRPYAFPRSARALPSITGRQRSPV